MFSLLSFMAAKHKKRTILLIEDNPETQLIFKVYLREKYNVDVCDNAESGIAKFDSNIYDLLLLDINLSGDLDGNDVLNHIRNKKNNQDFPIIVVTAYAMKGDMEKFINLGANDYLPKPIDKNALLSKIKNLID